MHSLPIYQYNYDQLLLSIILNVRDLLVGRINTEISLSNWTYYQITSIEPSCSVNEVNVERRKRSKSNN